MKKKTNLLTFLLYLSLFALICSFIFIYYFEKALGKSLIICAENEVKRLTSLVVNNSIKKYNKTSNLTNMLEINKNNKEEITYIHYDTKKINDITTKITEILQTDLDNMTKGNFKKINLNLDIITEDYYEKINNGIVFTISSSTGTSIIC